MPDPSLELPDFASAGNYVSSNPEFDGQPRRDDSLMVTEAPAGLVPYEPFPAVAMNSFLARVREHLVELVGQDLWGSGYSGDATVSSNTSLSADLHCDTLTINVGVTLDTNDYRVFARRIVNNGTIHNDGNDGGAASGGVVGPAGAASSGGTLAATRAGGQGGNASGDNGDPGANATYRLGSAGGAGGDTPSFSGGAAGSVTVVPGSAGRAQGSNGDLGHVHQAIAGRALDGTQFQGGSGGGGGAGQNDEGGGGGAGGGIVLLVARVIENNGTIRARGGAGGAGWNRGSGGGGGGGGAVIIVSRFDEVGAGTVSVAGGAAGAAGGGVGSQAGTAGTTGTIYRFRM